MGLWIELGIFLLVFVFAAWQFHDLKKAKAERIARERAADTPAAGTPPPAPSGPADPPRDRPQP